MTFTTTLSDGSPSSAERIRKQFSRVQADILLETFNGMRGIDVGEEPCHGRLVSHDCTIPRVAMPDVFM